VLLLLLLTVAVDVNRDVKQAGSCNMQKAAMCSMQARLLYAVCRQGCGCDMQAKLLYVICRQGCGCEYAGKAAVVMCRQAGTLLLLQVDSDCT